MKLKINRPLDSHCRDTEHHRFNTLRSLEVFVPHTRVVDVLIAHHVGRRLLVDVVASGRGCLVPHACQRHFRLASFLVIVCLDDL